MIYPGEAKLKLVNLGKRPHFCPIQFPFIYSCHLTRNTNSKSMHVRGQKKGMAYTDGTVALTNKPIQKYSWLHCTDITKPKDIFTSAATKDLQLNKDVKQKIECRLQHQGMDSTCILSRPN